MSQFQFRYVEFVCSTNKVIMLCPKDPSGKVIEALPFQGLYMTLSGPLFSNLKAAGKNNRVSRRKQGPHCPRFSLPLSSTLLLPWVLPTAFAQLTSSLFTTSPTSTTLSNSRTHLPSSSSNPPPKQTQSDHTSPTSTNSSTINYVGDHAFNYYFLIVAVLALIFCGCIIWAGRRKKRKAAMLRSQSQRALARDVEGWRARFRAGLGTNTVRVLDEERDDGLDERGEAPPPYVAGSKPPSIRSRENGRSTNVGTAGADVELRTMNVENSPPGYHEAATENTDEDAGDITRPARAVTVSEDYEVINHY